MDGSKIMRIQFAKSKRDVVKIYNVSFKNADGAQMAKSYPHFAVLSFSVFIDWHVLISNYPA